MRKGFKIYLPLFIIIILMVSTTGCNRTAGNPKDLSVKITVVDQHKLQINLDVSGILIPVQTANITAKVSGQVNNIKVTVGSKVNVGDILVTLETKELNAQLQQAEAALKTANDQSAQAKVNLDATENAYYSTKQLLADQEAQAKINFDSSERAYKRAQELAKSGAITRSQLEDDQSRYELSKKQYEMVRVDTGSSALSQLSGAASKYDLARKQYEIASSSALGQAQAAVNTIQVQLDNATILSPMSGIVTNKYINIGENASPGASLLTIADTSILKLKGTVSQEALPLLKPGQETEVSIDIYPGKEFKGQIDSIGPLAVSTGVYFPIEINLKNSGDIKAGLTAHASIDITTEDGIVVPSSAVIQNDGQNYVFVIKNNTASKRIVTTGMKSDKEIVILKGLDAGEQIAVTNVNILFDNVPVTVTVN